uniref:Enoyl reductase (ER) domain-containing protein n=1 Tax=Homalodisca liturata TaxID=320908 RepID=A0A1B6IQ36_9HEMI
MATLDNKSATAEISELISSTSISKVEDVLKVRSVVLTGNGSYDLIKVIEWPLMAKCAEHEVRVAVEFCGVNFADVYHMKGNVLQWPVPYVLGLESAGKVTQVGSAVRNLHVGDRVVCYCPNEAGMFRESVVVPSTHCFVIPGDICTKVACTLIANYLSAYFAFFSFGNLRSGQTVLIHSAAGGVGWAATQLAASVVGNVRVLGTASENKHHDIVTNGVTEAFTYENYSTHILDAEVDIVIDNIGGDNVKKSVDLLKPFGRVILTGVNCVVQEDESKVAKAFESIASSVVPMQELVMGNKSVCGLHLGTLLRDNPKTFHTAVEQIFSLCQQGLIEPRIHAVFPLSKASEAIKLLAERKNIGKVLLKVE